MTHAHVPSWTLDRTPHTEPVDPTALDRAVSKVGDGFPAVSGINHGTYGGAQAHQRRGETPCDECKAARAAYMRELRKDPEGRVSRLARQYAADRARRRLAALHPEEYHRFYAEEARAALGQPRLDAEVRP